jgi:hypothetical protein
MSRRGSVCTSVICTTAYRKEGLGVPRERVGKELKYYDGGKAWSSINHSILSGLWHLLNEQNKKSAEIVCNYGNEAT